MFFQNVIKQIQTIDISNLLDDCLNGLQQGAISILLANNNKIVCLQSYISMKRTKKFLKFQDIELQTLQQHPRDISRARLKIIDTENGNAEYKTFNYGHVEPTKVTWTSPIEMPFEAQESLRFETACQHEYGYQIQQLRAMYNGIIYVKPDQFFFINTTHSLNQEGVQCGTLKFMIKIVQKEEEVQPNHKPKQIQPKQPVKVNMVAKVSIYGATLSVNSYFSNTFHKKKRKNMRLQIRYDIDTFKGQSRFGELEYKWLVNCKFQVNDNSPQVIYITILEDDHLFLQGLLTLKTLEENKRFTVQVVQLKDQNDDNLANLHLDLRYISKRQLLDLMYSPKQLATHKLQRKQQQKHFTTSRLSSVIDGIKLDKQKKLYQMLHNRSNSKNIHSSRDNYSPIHNYRYKVRVASDHQQTTIPRSKRFHLSKPINQQVSYIDPSFGSDFSPKNSKKGIIKSQTNKTDFAKPGKANPGVGLYHLPSIWEKK